MQKIYSAHQVYEDKRIYWIRSYKAVLKYMNIYSHILKPITTGENDSSNRRYYVTEENLKRFVRMFENSELV